MRGDSNTVTFDVRGRQTARNRLGLLAGDRAGTATGVDGAKDRGAGRLNAGMSSVNDTDERRDDADCSARASGEAGRVNYIARVVATCNST